MMIVKAAGELFVEELIERFALISLCYQVILSTLPCNKKE